MDHSSTLTSIQRSLTGGRTEGGLDVVYTKLAVDLQNLRDRDADEVLQRSLDTLRDAVDCDAVFVATLNDTATDIDRIYTAQSAFTAANPAALEGRSLETLPWIAEHLQHLRLVGIQDSFRPAPGQEADAERLTELQIGALMLLAFEARGRMAGFMAFVYGQPQANWSVDHQLLIKLLGTSFASGLDRLRTSANLDDMEERDALLICTANDGTWDFDAMNNVMHFSPRWKTIMGYTRRRSRKSAPPDWQKLVHQDDLAKVQMRLREHLAGKTDIFESDAPDASRRDGEWRWVQCRAKGLARTTRAGCAA